MDYLWIILAVILVGGTIAFLVINSKKNNCTSNFNLDKNVINSTLNISQSEKMQQNELCIIFEQLSHTSEINENNLHEITDKKVITRIAETLPEVAQIVTRNVTNNAVKNLEVYNLHSRENVTMNTLKS